MLVPPSSTPPSSNRLRAPTSSSICTATELQRRSYSSGSNPDQKVAILGTTGGIAQPLSLIMKLNPLVSSLSLYDIAGTPGVAADVIHINSPANVVGFAGEEQLGLLNLMCSAMVELSGLQTRLKT